MLFFAFRQTIEKKTCLFRALLDYQVDINFGMAQSSSTSVTGHHSSFYIGYRLLRHQIYSEVLIHLHNDDAYNNFTTQ